MKVTVVGGGSTYTPELVDGIARLQHLFGVDELVLTDPAEQRLALVAGVSQRIFAKYAYPGHITFTTDLDRAVADAAIVLLQLRVGGQAARAVDESLPLRCGCVGQETTGAGGLAKALRTVPVILEIADRVSRLAAKDAWIIDFTNPVGIVTRALLDHDHRAVGLCNVAIGNQRAAAALLGVEPAQVALDHVGLNHLTWTRQVLVDEQDQLPELLASSAEALAGVPVYRQSCYAGWGCGPRTIFATSMNMITSSSSSGRTHLVPKRWPRLSGSCWRSMPTLRSMRNQPCSSNVAAPTTPRLRWT